MIKAVIFDMDGVIVNNHHYHYKAFQAFCKKYNFPLTENYYKENFNGRVMAEIVEIIFNEKLSREDVLKYEEEKEKMYRELYAPDIKPVDGLTDFLKELKDNGIPTAIATSAPTKNVEFTMKHTGVDKYIDVIVDSSGVTKGKPDPEIYLKAARLINMPPENCLVFEDAILGIKAGKGAGMKVIALATTHAKEELKDHSQQIIPSFKDFRLKSLSAV